MIFCVAGYLVACVLFLADVARLLADYCYVLLLLMCWLGVGLLVSCDLHAVGFWRACISLLFCIGWLWLELCCCPFSVLLWWLLVRLLLCALDGWLCWCVLWYLCCGLACVVLLIVLGGIVHSSFARLCGCAWVACWLG